MLTRGAPVRSIFLDVPIPVLVLCPWDTRSTAYRVMLPDGRVFNVSLFSLSYGDGTLSYRPRFTCFLRGRPRDPAHP